MNLDYLHVVHVFSTGIMAGLIWFVQVVHYPLFQAVDEREFGEYERRHQQRTTMIVAPCMLMEAVSAALLAVYAPAGQRVWAYIGLELLALVWLSTFLVQVPLHKKLQAGKDMLVIRRLVVTNWVRTALWSARFAIALWMLKQWVRP